jgi:lysophospholipase L1-like esterase
MQKMSKILVGFLLLSANSFAQLNPFDIPKYDFISYQDNSLIINENNHIESLFYKLDTLILQGKGKIRILHIGDSHIQADYVSGQIRKRFHEMAWGLNGGRGFVFPVSMAKSNNPWNYKVNYSGHWQYVKNTQDTHALPIGIAGYTLYTKSDSSRIEISFPCSEYPKYDFNQMQIFHNMDTANWEIRWHDSTEFVEIKHDFMTGSSHFFFENLHDTVRIDIIKKNENCDAFVFHGICLENNDQGIIYHSVGVNGAEVESWLKSELLPQHIQALKPDLIIIALGTNDSYTSRFDSVKFEQNLRMLVSEIYKCSPDATLLWVSPGDNYRYRRYLNYSTEKANRVILRTGKELNFIVWNFYDIMGELNAIMNWHYAGLTARDKLHFNKQGYILQGNLLFNAILKAYNLHIDNPLN